MSISFDPVAYMQDRRLGPRHALIVDPPNQHPLVAARRAAAAVRAGSRLILVGGSTGVNSENTRATVLAIRQALEDLYCASDPEALAIAPGGTGVPVILFPSSAEALCREADASLYPILINSRSRRYLVSEPVRIARIANEVRLRTVATAYLVCSPGGTVGMVSRAMLVSPTDETSIVGYALAAKSLGLKLIYLEAGSGAAFPVSSQLIRAARTASGLPVVASGGIRSAEEATRAVRAGADWVVTGSLAETITDFDELERVLRGVISAMNV